MLKVSLRDRHLVRKVYCNVMYYTEIRPVLVTWYSVLITVYLSLLLSYEVW